MSLAAVGNRIFENSIPGDWEIMTYGRIFDFLNTATYSRADLSNDGEYGYIHYGDIHTKWDCHLDLTRHRIPNIDKLKANGFAV